MHPLARSNTKCSARHSGMHQWRGGLSANIQRFETAFASGAQDQQTESANARSQAKPRARMDYFRRRRRSDHG